MLAFAMGELRAHWTLDPEVVFLNHGSYGACPRAVIAAQSAIRDELERQPVRFFRELGARIDAARAVVATFVGADPADCVFVRNATSAVNAVLASVDLRPGDEVLTTDHAYGACLNALERWAGRAGARVVVARIPFPGAHPDLVLERVLDAVTARTRLALLDHVTSPTGLAFPIAALARELAARQVAVLVDGAHGPGQVSSDGLASLDALGQAGVTHYAANLHKWTCAPKGAGLLWVRPDHQRGLHPAVISHGYRPRPHRSRLHEEFDWTGTDDPSPWLCVPTALEAVAALVPGGWPAVRERNTALARSARRVLCEALEIEVPAPDGMIGSLASVPIPGPFGGDAFTADPLQSALYEGHRIEVPVFRSPPGGRILRVSAHLYNDRADYERLASALAVALARA